MPLEPGWQSIADTVARWAISLEHGERAVLGICAYHRAPPFDTGTHRRTTKIPMSTTTATTATGSIAAKGYAHPDALVSTEWLAEHLERPEHPHRRERRGRAALRHGPHPRRHQDRLARRSERPARARLHLARAVRGAASRARASTTRRPSIFYGDKNNWWAAYAFWVFQLFGFTNAKILDGGRMKWEQEGRPMTTDAPAARHAIDLHRPASAATSADSRVHDRRAKAPRRDGQARRRPLARRVHRQEAAHAGVSAGGRDARRAHPGREERSVGARRESPTARSSRPPSCERSTRTSRGCRRPTT